MYRMNNNHSRQSLCLGISMFKLVNITDMNLRTVGQFANLHLNSIWSGFCAYVDGDVKKWVTGEMVLLSSPNLKFLFGKLVS